MDEFRSYQKEPFGDGRRRKRGRYGCSCCCKYNVCLRAAKIIARKHAKGKFRNSTKKLVREGIQEHNSFQEDY